MAHKLLEGFKTFKKEAYNEATGTMLGLIKEGQDPDYFIISCIDSRANPGMIFRPEPGTFFAHKAMGAIVRPYKKGTALAAALQFSFKYNNVKKLIVCGHTECGAIKALINGIEDEEIAPFLEVAKSGVAKAEAKVSAEAGSQFVYRQAEKEIILQSAKNLMTYPSVMEAFEKGNLQIIPWLFDMSKGEIHEYSEEKDDFVPIAGHLKLEHPESGCC